MVSGWLIRDLLREQFLVLQDLHDFNHGKWVITRPSKKFRAVAVRF